MTEYPNLLQVHVHTLHTLHMELYVGILVVIRGVYWEKSGDTIRITIQGQW